MLLATADLDTEHPRIALSGRFDAFETSQFRAAIDTMIAKKPSHLSVVMSDVSFVDSSGLAELVRAMKLCRAGHGNLHIVNPSEPVRVILELTRLDAALSVVSD